MLNMLECRNLQSEYTVWMVHTWNLYKKPQNFALFEYIYIYKFNEKTEWRKIITIKLGWLILGKVLGHLNMRSHSL